MYRLITELPLNILLVYKARFPDAQAAAEYLSGIPHLDGFTVAPQADVDRWQGEVMECPLKEKRVKREPE